MWITDDLIFSARPSYFSFIREKTGSHICCFMLWFFLDNHDLISFKLYELTVERTPEEEDDQLEITLPSVDYRVDPDGKAFRKHNFICKACDLKHRWVYLTFVCFLHSSDGG